MATLLGSLISDLVQASDADGDEAGHVQSAFVAPEIPPSKVQGVRAKKSISYVERPETVAEMYVSVLAVGPLEKYLYWLFKQQRDETWLSSDPAKRPLVALTSESDNNPVLLALAEYAAALASSPVESEDLSDLRGPMTASHIAT
jgi:hypothetical protein